MPQIQLLDGKKIPFTKSISGFELAKKISKSLEKVALIMEVDGELKDLSHEITQDSKVRIITPKDKSKRGAQLSILAHGMGKSLFDFMTKKGVIADWREPNVIRLATIPFIIVMWTVLSLEKY